MPLNSTFSFLMSCVFRIVFFNTICLHAVFTSYQMAEYAVVEFGDKSVSLVHNRWIFSSGDVSFELFR